MYITLFIIALLLIGVLYEQYARHKAKVYPVDGNFVDVGGHKLHYLKKGQGKATIIFESGEDYGGHIIWRNIQDKLSKNFSTLSYDRAGILHSQRGKNPKTGTAIAKELHTLIKTLDLPKPYLFVGHSLAGLTLRSFMEYYPQDVVGIVLVDPTEAKTFYEFPEKLRKLYNRIPPKWLLSTLLSLGIIRLLFSKVIDKATIDAYKSEKENYKEAVDLTHKSFDAYVEDVVNLKALSAETKEIDFGDIPIVLLAATKQPMKDEIYDEAMQVTKRLHLETVSRYPNRQYIPVDSAHTIQFEKPDFVVEVVEELAKEVLKSNAINN